MMSLNRKTAAAAARADSNTLKEWAQVPVADDIAGARGIIGWLLQPSGRRANAAEDVLSKSGQE